MHKIKYVIMMMAAVLLIFGAVSYAQPLNDWETGIFQDLAETWHNKLYVLPPGKNSSDIDFEEIYAELAKKYNISAEQVQDIDLDTVKYLADFHD